MCYHRASRMLEKLQSFTEGRYDLSRTDMDNIYDEQIGDVASTLEALPVVQRQVSTAKLMSQAGHTGLGRAGSTAGSSIGRTASTSSYGAKAPLGRQPSSTSSIGKTMPPPVRGTGGAAAPPAYTPPPAGSDVGANPAGAKRAPPPPPPLKPKPSYGAPAVKYVVALFDFEAQAAGDLSFSVGDRIELVERTGSAEDWWTGRIDGRQGVFPGASFVISTRLRQAAADGHTPPCFRQLRPRRVAVSMFCTVSICPFRSPSCIPSRLAPNTLPCWECSR